ncbi:putative B3 domain-containing protein [Acorus gramineus]|uniref:B3 domain-containing protein n=1 Tax=Acorus gramineus TaxID=55184 RepID=A0AAV9BK82_ACOGR|nr:putative B3 domain-containing protein [Acorus gramineus]
MVSPPFDRRPHFFKVFLPGVSSERLGIPRAFWKHIEGLSAGTVSLVGPSRKIWHVNLVKNGNGVFFENGWREFTKDHSLQTGEFLLFRFDENSHFNVSVYDKTACEKEEAFYAESCDGSCVTEDHENVKKVLETDIKLPSTVDCKAPSRSSKRKRGEKIQPVVEQLGPRYQVSPSTKPRKRQPAENHIKIKIEQTSVNSKTTQRVATKTRKLKPRKIKYNNPIGNDTASPSTKPRKPAENNVKIEQNSINSKTTKKGAMKRRKLKPQRIEYKNPIGNGRVCFDMHLENLGPRQRSAKIKERQVAFQNASSFVSKNPSARVVIYESYMRTLRLPSAFSKKFLPQNSTDMVLSVPGGDKWVVKYVLCLSGLFCVLSGGWSRFISGNAVEIGDSVVFELLGENEMCAHIFRASNG